MNDDQRTFKFKVYKLQRSKNSNKLCSNLSLFGDAGLPRRFSFLHKASALSLFMYSVCSLNCNCRLDNCGKWWFRLFRTSSHLECTVIIKQKKKTLDCYYLDNTFSQSSFQFLFLINSEGFLNNNGWMSNFGHLRSWWFRYLKWKLLR